ncbi:MAG: SGNH/GDSL hydrolase family protein [Negativicutes bacterium]
MKILVIGDSVGLPRLKKNSGEVELYYEDAYPEQIRKIALKRFRGEDVLLVNACRHAQTSSHLLRGAANEVCFLQPDYVVLQLGMTDLWPAAGRSVPPPFPELAGKDPWVGPDEYTHNIELFLRYCFIFPDLSVVLVNIPKCSQSQYAQNGDAFERTLHYNKLLEKFALSTRVVLVDAYSLFHRLGEAALGSDGIHPTREASRQLGEMIGAAMLPRGIMAEV